MIRQKEIIQIPKSYQQVKEEYLKVINQIIKFHGEVSIGEIYDSLVTYHGRVSGLHIFADV